MRRLMRSSWVGLALVMAFGTAVIRSFADQVDDLIEAEMKERQVAGLACLIIKDGQTRSIYRGMANLELNVPVTGKTVFEIGSVTKQFTAACVLMLQEQGKLSLESPISRYLTNTPDSWSKITVRHLLNHTSGITNYDSIPGFEMRQHLTQARFIKQLAPYPLGFEPGSRWSYCNSAFNLLGYIIENVSGTNYWAFLQNNIFDPLNMTQSTRRDPALIIPYRASGYEATNHVMINRNSDLTELVSAGAIVSTVNDLAKWNAALDGDQLLNKESKELWWAPTTLNDGTVKEYGFAWYVNPFEGHRNIGHSGTTSGFSATLQRFPDDHLAIIILATTDTSGFSTKLAKKIAPLYLEQPSSGK